MNTIIILGIIGGVFILVCIIILIVIISKTQNKFQPKEDIPPVPEPSPSPPPTKKYNISPDYHIIDKEYYRLGVLENKKDQDLTHIRNILDSLIQSIKSETIKQNLKKEKPIYLIGETPLDFKEFDWLKDVRSTDGNRNIMDLTAFATNLPTPGYISSKYNNCYCGYLDEDIIVHEFLHTIQLSGFDNLIQEEFMKLYNEYKVINNDYSITSYAFLNDRELFSELGQVYFGVTTRMDEASTGGINLNLLKTKLPKLYSFMDNIFKSENSVRQKSCAQNCPNCNFSYCK